MASQSIVELWNRALSFAGSTALLSTDVEEEGGGVEGEQCRLHHPAVLRYVLEARPWPHAKRQKAITELDEQVGADQVGDGANTTFQVDIPFRDQDSLTVEIITISSGAVADTLDTDEYTVDEESEPPILELDTAPTALQAVRVTAANERIGFEHVFALPSDCVTPLALLADGERYSIIDPDERHKFEIQSTDKKDGQVLCCDLDATDFEVLEYIALFENVRAMPAAFEEAYAWRLASILADALVKDPQRAAYCARRYEIELGAAFANQLNAQQVSEPDVPTIAARG